MATLYRMNCGDRLFPPLGQTMPPEDTARYAAAVLMTSPEPLTFLNRAAGLRLNCAQWLTRLLHLRQRAMAAEQAGRWTTADFFFREISLKLKAAPETHPTWSELLEKASSRGGRPPLTPRELYRAVVDELCVDLHCAYYNAYAAALAEPKDDARQFAHLGYIKTLLELSRASQETQRALIGPGLEDLAAAAFRASKWKPCRDAVEELLKRFPTDRKYSETGAAILFECALKSLANGKESSSARTDAKRLESSARRMDRLCLERPDCALAFDLAGRLHHLRAVKLANGDVTSEALVEIEKALVYCPDWKEAQQARAQIEELMKAVAKQAVELAAAVRRTPNARLNAHGQRVSQQAAQGHGPVRAYLQSEEPARVRKALNVAKLRTFWHRVGLAPPADRWEERAGKLLDAMTFVNGKIGSNFAAFEPVWRGVVGGDPDLLAVDASSVRRFLEFRDAPQVESSAPQFVPMLPVPAGERKRGREPLEYWVFSRQNPVLKVQTAIAVILVVVALAMSAWHGFEMRTRERAWAAAERAVASGDDLAALSAYERFFATLPTEQDPRTSEAREMYRGALVRWFLNLPGQPDAAALERVERYRQIATNGSAKGGAQ